MLLGIADVGELQPYLVQTDLAQGAAPDAVDTKRTKIATVTGQEIATTTDQVCPTCHLVAQGRHMCFVQDLSKGTRK